MPRSPIPVPASDPGPGDPPRVVPPWVAAALALLVAVFALDLFRAATQSVTHDEALTFHYYLARPFSALFGEYDPNNHLAHTLLAWCSVRLFGVNELALRAPALLGGLLYLGATLALCRRAFGAGPVMLLAFALGALHPLLLDFQSVARGYGLALAFALLALHWVLVAFYGCGKRPRRRRRLLELASLAMGLSVTSNLTLAPMVCALGLLAGLELLRSADRPERPIRQRLADLARLVLPGALPAAALLLPALLGADPNRFYVGSASLSDTAADLLRWSLAHQPSAWPLDPAGSALPTALWILGHVLLPLLLALAFLAWLAALGRPARDGRSGGGRAEPAEPVRQLVGWAGGTLCLGLILLGVLHTLLGLPYPIDRTGLWLIALVQLCAVGLATLGWMAGGLARLAGAAGGLLLAALLVQYGSQIQSREYGVWRKDAGTARLFEALQREQQRHPGTSLSVGCGWFYQPSLNFYRHARHASWMPWLSRGYDLTRRHYDWLIFHPDDDPGTFARLQELLARDPLSGTVIGRPGTDR